MSVDRLVIVESDALYCGMFVIAISAVVDQLASLVVLRHVLLISLRVTHVIALGMGRPLFSPAPVCSWCWLVCHLADVKGGSIGEVTSLLKWCSVAVELRMLL